MLATVNTRPMKLWRGLNDDFEQWLSQPDRYAEAPARWVPSVDVIEEQDHYVFHADLPGVELSQIEVLFDEGMLTIKGERQDGNESVEDKDADKATYHRIERSYGAFQRSFRLPDAINADKITAKSNNGVLEIRVPKQEKAQRKIEIQG